MYLEREGSCEHTVRRPLAASQEEGLVGHTEISWPRDRGLPKLPGL